MTSSKVLEWALFIDFAILVMLSIDVYISYQNLKLQQAQRGWE